jgi:hypothetical protein
MSRAAHAGDGVTVPPHHYVQEVLGAIASTMGLPKGSPEDLEAREVFGKGWTAILARGRAEALIAMLQEPLVRERIEAMQSTRAIMRRRNFDRRRGK